MVNGLKKNLPEHFQEGGGRNVEEDKTVPKKI